MTAPTRLDAARNYLRQGYVPVPVPARQKSPALKCWNALRLGEHELDDHFAGVGNIGLLLGSPSNNLVDVDLDCEEARLLAPQFLPTTSAKVGRPSSPNSHWFYRSTGVRTTRHRDASAGGMIVEVRSDGCQTLVGPSIHPSGEPYDMLVGDPAEVHAADLAERVEQLHDAVLLRRYGELPSGRERLEESSPSGRTSIHGSDAVARATAYLRRMAPSISGQGGHGRAYAAATAMVHGFELDAGAALGLLQTHFNPRCDPPWSEKELLHKVEDALTKPHNRPKGWLSDRPRAGEAIEIECAGHEATPSGSGIVLGLRDDETGRLILSPRQTLPTARAFVDEFHTHADGPGIVCFAGELYVWRGNRYVPIEDWALRNQVQPWLHSALRPVKSRQGEVTLVDFDSNPATVNAAVESVKSHTYIPATTPIPSWLGPRPHELDAAEILACRSTNIHIPTRAVIPATPRLFTTAALDFDFQPEPEVPERWMKFLEQLWGDDIESCELLQEWFGYCLTADTSLQKMLMIVGPKRSGKGTIGRVLKCLVGANNVVGPTTTSLSASFGLQPLIGKPLAIVSDARFGGSTTPVVVERLLCISGEDALTIDRKYLGAVSMKLPTRFMFFSNELPRFNDASAALPSRFLVLRLTKSFYGNEDPQLTERLREELPGILLWALDGVRRLLERGRFKQPESAAQSMADMEDLASPVGAFVRERCEVAPGLRAGVDELFGAWNQWCERDGRMNAGNKQVFGKNLSAAVPSVVRRRGSNQTAFYQGIAIQGGG